MAMIPFTVFTFLNTSDMGIYVSAYTIEYFALRRRGSGNFSNGL